ncbi:histidine kinase dimerisation and phosphoacceptor region [Beutenbergia cavernae DSM 12333]|uniref:Histidine kinase dimerisation and phosphoacceptor region n=2 Tax=Beutenbergia TaxID=84756 RepID=C5BW94_BEUC1|nr:histidine kinase dimerisation and phosphoacceptor region [Beutenbergia cavernae DSM 12333]
MSHAGRSRAWRFLGPLLAIVWVAFLAEPLSAALAADDLWVRVVSVVGVVGVGITFAFSMLFVRREQQSPSMIVLLVALELFFTAISCLGAHEHGLVGLVYVSATVHVLTRSPRAFVTTILCAAAAFVLPRVIPGWDPADGTVAAVVLASLATFGFTQLIRRNRQLLAAQREIAELAAARERARLARDVHDLVGHSLTVVAVKAELARRLVSRDPDAATGELADIHELARSALADVRSMVQATRGVTLPGELVAARQALDAAGIEAQLPGAVDVVPDPLREPFAWVVREGVTNVLRHAGASRVVVTLAADRLVVEDDGRGPGPDSGAAGAPAPGQGIAGLTERLRAVGATLETGTSSLGGFRLAARAGGAA